MDLRFQGIRLRERKLDWKDPSSRQIQLHSAPKWAHLHSWRDDLRFNLK